MIQGISPGWGDTYDYYRTEQWIDLTPRNAARRPVLTEVLLHHRW
jgi:hypothetical protein